MIDIPTRYISRYYIRVNRHIDMICLEGTTIALVGRSCASQLR